MAKKIKDEIDSFTNGTSFIDDERVRQCTKGYGRDHDDGHADGSMLYAAMDILVGIVAEEGAKAGPGRWATLLADRVGDKYRSAPIKRLVIAASMIVAEIERRERIELAKR